MRDVVDYVDKIIFSQKSIGKMEDGEDAQAGTVGRTSTLHHVIVKRLRREGSRISLVKGSSSVGGSHLCCFPDDPEKE